MNEEAAKNRAPSKVFRSMTIRKQWNARAGRPDVGQQLLLFTKKNPRTFRTSPIARLRSQHTENSLSRMCPPHSFRFRRS